MMAKSNTTQSQSSAVSLKEHLSAVLDDEAGKFEQRRVFDELKRSEDLRQSTSMYALIGETMRSDQVSLVASSHFLSGIQDTINAETKDSLPVAPSSISWLKPVGGFALAASVAAVSVIGFQNYQQLSGVSEGDVAATTIMQPQDSALSVDEMNKATVISADKMVANSRSLLPQYRQADTKTRSLLKRFVDSHLRHASTTALVPSVRVIAYAD